jgi:hypothetical protein
MGLIYATIGEHETAVERFVAATGLDNYLAVALVPPPILSHPSCLILNQFQLLPMRRLELFAWPL